MEDELSGWKHRILEGDGTLYDVEVNRCRNAIKKEEDNLVRIRNALKKEAVDWEVKEEAYNQLTHKKGKTLPPRTERDRLRREEAETIYEIDSLRAEFRNNEALQAATVKEIQNLRTLVRYYKENHDMDYLRKGVHLFCLEGLNTRTKIQ